MLLTPPTDWLAEPDTLVMASATPHPSHKHPGAVASAPVGRNLRPTTVVPEPEDGKPPGTFRCPSLLIPSWTTPLLIMFGDTGRGGRISMELKANFPVASCAVRK